MADTEDSRERKRAVNRAWHIANRERARATDKTWYAANREHMSAIRKARREANHERLLAREKAWREANPERNAFITQRADAKRRGIEFLFTFEEWLAIWQDSGKWEHRGPRTGQYVMARFGDKGPYAVGNVRICTTGENTVETFTHYIPSEETKRRISAAAKARKRQPHSEETKKQISESNKRTYQQKHAKAAKGQRGLPQPSTRGAQSQDQSSARTKDLGCSTAPRAAKPARAARPRPPAPPSRY